MLYRKLFSEINKWSTKQADYGSAKKGSYVPTRYTASDPREADGPLQPQARFPKPKNIKRGELCYKSSASAITGTILCRRRAITPFPPKRTQLNRRQRHLSRSSFPRRYINRSRSLTRSFVRYIYYPSSRGRIHTLISTSPATRLEGKTKRRDASNEKRGPRATPEPRDT